MKIWRVSPTHPEDNNLTEAATALQQGKLVAFPTETVYGLGANAVDEAAVQRVFAVKGRPVDNPLIVHIADKKDLHSVISTRDPLPAAVVRAIDVFWPGPLTLILPASENLAPSVHPGRATVAVRMPNHPVAKALIRLAGCPIAAPSANRSGKPSPTLASDVLEDLTNYLLPDDGLVDGGSCDVGVESTVVAIEANRAVIYRPGGVSKEQLQAVLDMPVELDPHLDEFFASTSTPSSATRPSAPHPAVDAGMDAATDAVAASAAPSAPLGPLAPGMKYRHYAPNAQVRVWWGTSSAVRNGMREFVLLHPQERMAVVSQEPWLNCPANVVYWAPPDWGPKGSKEDYATRLSRGLYRLLREFDRRGVAHILIEGVEPRGLGLAVMNRLSKASEGRVFHV